MAKTDKNHKLNNDEDKDLLKKNNIPTIKVDNNLQNEIGEEIPDGEKPQKKVKEKFDKTCSRCGINPNLLFLKISLFVMYGATAALLPYLTIHMQSIGLTVEDIAIIYLALPLTTFLAPPLTGEITSCFKSNPESINKSITEFFLVYQGSSSIN